MSLHSADVQLAEAVKQLRQRWARIRERWDDGASRQIEAEFVEPLEPLVRAASRAIDHVRALSDSARRECGDDR